MVFIPLTGLIGEQAAIYAYTLVVLGLEFAVWFGQSFVGGAVAVSLMGLLMGPHYVFVVLSILASSLSLLTGGVLSFCWVIGSSCLPAQNSYLGHIKVELSDGSLGNQPFPFVY